MYGKLLMLDFYLILLICVFELLCLGVCAMCVCFSLLGLVFKVFISLVFPGGFPFGVWFG